MIRDKVIDCLLLMERVYPKPTTQAMMVSVPAAAHVQIRLIQDYYDCPVFYLPWTKEALTVHLYAPLTDRQLEDAKNAEKQEKQDRFAAAAPQGGESVYLDFDMGTDLVKPDVFTKQMYMRSFLRRCSALDKAPSRTRGNTTFDDAPARSRASTVVEMGMPHPEKAAPMALCLREAKSERRCVT